MSVVWKYFKVNDENQSIAECKLCSTKLSRGSMKTRSYSPSNVVKRLKKKKTK